MVSTTAEPSRDFGMRLSHVRCGSRRPSIQTPFGLVLALVLCLLPRGIIASDAGDSSQPKKEYWESYVRRSGERLGCHFTMEMLWPKHDAGIYSLLLDDDANIQSVDALIEKLTRDVRPMAFVRSVNNPSVVHVIDRELLKQEGYALEKKVTVKYRGVVDGLLVELHKHVKSITRKTSGSWRTVFDDHTTKVSVDAKNLRMREVLTDCVPLENYHPILWRTQTRIVDGKPYTTLQYYGPKSTWRRER